jgi:potassium voltage-gated channel Eag-related subfamily H protein 8
MGLVKLCGEGVTMQPRRSAGRVRVSDMHGAGCVGAVFVMMYVCHIVSCIWYYVGDDDGGTEGWISKQLPLWTGNPAAEKADLASVDLSTKYITAFYWSITTISTVGFGDIVAQTQSERLFSIMAEMFGSLMFAVLIGVLGSMMVGQKLLEEKVSKQLSELREFMQAKGIPKELRIKIRRYMETLYEHKSGFDEGDVLRQLPPAMAQELLHSMYKGLITNVPLFEVGGLP